MKRYGTEILPRLENFRSSKIFVFLKIFEFLRNFHEILQKNSKFSNKDETKFFSTESQKYPSLGREKNFRTVP